MDCSIQGISTLFTVLFSTRLFDWLQIDCHCRCCYSSVTQTFVSHFKSFIHLTIITTIENAAIFLCLCHSTLSLSLTSVLVYALASIKKEITVCVRVRKHLSLNLIFKKSKLTNADEKIKVRDREKASEISLEIYMLCT